MSKPKKDTSNNTETLIYCVLGGVVCCYIVPSYIPVFICVGGLLASVYGIVNILDKNKSIEDMSFVEKEKIEYFKNK